MIPKFGEYHEGYGAELACPSCGFNYLHHDKVEVFECGEDATGPTHHSTGRCAMKPRSASEFKR